MPAIYKSANNKSFKTILGNVSFRFHFFDKNNNKTLKQAM